MLLTAAERTPTTTRSGFMKSSMAAPSLRNSGLLATWHSRPVSSFSCWKMDALVPTGTVLLVTTTASGLRSAAIVLTTVHKAVKSAAPSWALGVPTARKTRSADRTAWEEFVVKCNLSADRLR